MAQLTVMMRQHPHDVCSVPSDSNLCDWSQLSDSTSFVYVGSLLNVSFRFVPVRALGRADPGVRARQAGWRGRRRGCRSTRSTS